MLYICAKNVSLGSKFYNNASMEIKECIIEKEGLNATRTIKTGYFVTLRYIPTFDYKVISVVRRAEDS